MRVTAVLPLTGQGPKLKGTKTRILLALPVIGAQTDTSNSLAM